MQVKQSTLFGKVVYQMQDIEKLIYDLSELSFSYAENGDVDNLVLIERAIDTINELSEKHKWHVVADGDLPEVDGEYIVTCYSETDGYFVQQCLYGKETEDTYEYWDGLVNFEKVVAWKQLPKPYKKWQ